MKKTKHLATAIRSTTVALVLFSIMVTYYVMIVRKEYVIFTNPEGPETADYFEEFFIE